MRAYIVSLSFILLLFSSKVQAQYNSDQEKLFYTALEHIYDEDFTQALDILNYLDSVDLDNFVNRNQKNEFHFDNDSISIEKVYVKYLIGICYIESRYSKDKAVPYIEYVVNSGYSQTPEIIYKDLGELYHKRYDFKKAIFYFKKYIENITVADEYFDYAMHMVEVCDNASKLVTDTLSGSFIKLHGYINTNNSEVNPLISPDGNTLYYTQIKYSENLSGSLDSTFDIMMSEKVFDIWTKPSVISIQMPKRKTHLKLAGIAPDGHTLYLSIGNGYDNDIYTCHISGKECINLTEFTEVTSKYFEGELSLTPDGNTIYFSSDRPGGYGGMDIYTIKRNTNGQWGAPENLGPGINTRYNEESPFFYAINNTLYFTSQGHLTIGGYDIFNVRMKSNGYWSVPQNLGFPLNTPYDNRFFSISELTQTAYFSAPQFDEFENMDIYTFRVETSIPLTLLNGTIITGNDNAPSSATIRAYERQTKRLVHFSVNADVSTGKFFIFLKPGRIYDLIIQTDGYMPQLVSIYIPNQTYFYEIFQRIYLTPLTKLNKVLGEEIKINNYFFDVYKTNALDTAMMRNKKQYDGLLRLIDTLADIDDSLRILETLDADNQIMAKFDPEDLSNMYEDFLNVMLDAIENGDEEFLKQLDQRSAYKEEFSQRVFYDSRTGIADIYPYQIGDKVVYAAGFTEAFKEENIPQIEDDQDDRQNLIGPYKHAMYNDRNPSGISMVKDTTWLLVKSHVVYFNENNYKLSPDAIKDVDEIGGLLLDTESLVLVLKGYSSASGENDPNMKLSENRALSVKHHIMDLNVDGARIDVTAYGESMSMEEQSDYDRQMNRKVEIEIWQIVPINMGMN